MRDAVVVTIDGDGSRELFRRLGCGERKNQCKREGKEEESA
jgi:hypothetical protein